MASALSPFGSASPGAAAAPSNSIIYNNPFLPPAADSPPAPPRDPAAATSIEVRRVPSSGAAPAKRRDRHGAELAAFQRDRFPHSSRDTRYPDFLEKLLDEFVEAQLVVGRGADVQFSKESLQNARAKLTVATGTKGWRIWLKEPLFNRFRDLKQSSSPADTTHSEFVELLLDLHDLVEANDWDQIRHALTDMSRVSSEHSGVANLPIVPTMASMMPMPHRRHQSMSGILPIYNSVNTQQGGLRQFYVGGNTMGTVPMSNKEVNAILTQPAAPSMDSNWGLAPGDFGGLVGSPTFAELASHNGSAGVPPEFSNGFLGLSNTSADGIVKRSHTSPGNARTRGLSRSASQVPGDVLNRTKSLTNSNKKTRDGASSAPIPAQRRPSLRSVSGSSLRDEGILPPAFHGHRRTGSSLSTTSIRSTSSTNGIFYPVDSPVMRPLNELGHQQPWLADSELIMQGLEGINTLNINDAIFMEHQQLRQQQQQLHSHSNRTLEMRQSQAVPTYLTTSPSQALPLIVDFQANPIAASPFPQHLAVVGSDPGIGGMDDLSNSKVKAELGHQQLEKVYAYTTLGGVATEPVQAAGSAIMTDSLHMISSTSVPIPSNSLEAMYENLQTSINAGGAAQFSNHRPPPPQNLQEQQRQIAQHRLQQHENAVKQQQQQIQQQQQAFERHQHVVARQQIADQVQMQFQVQLQQQQQQLQQQSHGQQHQHYEHQAVHAQHMQMQAQVKEGHPRADAGQFDVSELDPMRPLVFAQQPLDQSSQQPQQHLSSANNGFSQDALGPKSHSDSLSADGSETPLFPYSLIDTAPLPPLNLAASPLHVAPVATPPQQHQPQQHQPQQHQPQQSPAQHTGWRFRSGSGSNNSSAVSPLPPPISTSGLPAGPSSSSGSATVSGAASPNGRSKRISKILNRLSFVKGSSNNSASSAPPPASPPLVGPVNPLPPS
ncbi:hypothetical protein HDU86_007762 [Geranomyces michiganensis]|nr:hypothetical protein HDU86_007762 [Geranomyces michiganensis]